MEFLGVMESGMKPPCIRIRRTQARGFGRSRDIRILFGVRATGTRVVGDVNNGGVVRAESSGATVNHLRS